MTTVMPQKELVRRAAAWVAERKAEKGGALGSLMDEAGMRFNLGPADQDFLKKLFAEGEGETFAAGKDVD
ncbi:hypothetical protein [Fundidesulfovibrio soli]|uniref:hypothetical protein n=1 Tax=Fundidesulfovibrio soli TaxID=2922716 RepID=UPI001FAF7048|nr:hypothetical protein [Fundidesulfovibrio soli]